MGYFLENSNGDGGSRLQSEFCDLNSKSEISDMVAGVQR